MINFPPKLHHKYALAGVLGCAISAAVFTPGTEAQVVPLWPAERLLAAGEPERFLLHLNAACTAAVRADRLAELQALIPAGGPGYMPRDEYARPLIFHAAEEAGHDLIRWLLAPAPAGGGLGTVKLRPIAGRTPLELAAEAGREARILELLAGSDSPAELRQLAAQRAARKGIASPLGEKGSPPPTSLPELLSEAQFQAAAGKIELTGLDLPEEHRAEVISRFCLLVAEQGRVPSESTLSELPAQRPADWVERGARALKRAVKAHEGSAERLWPLAQKEGWLTDAPPKTLAEIAAGSRKPGNLAFLLRQIPGEVAWERPPGAPSLTELVLEQMDLEGLHVLREHFPQRDLLDGLSARRIFARVFWDNVEAPATSWQPFLRTWNREHPEHSPLAWQQRQAELSQSRVALLHELRETHGLRLQDFPPDDLGPVLKAVLWLQDAAFYHELTREATPAQLAWSDEESIPLAQWALWCGVPWRNY